MNDQSHSAEFLELLEDIKSRTSKRGRYVTTISSSMVA